MSGFRRALLLLLLGLVCLAGFVTAMLPASLLVKEVRLPPDVTIAGVAGTVWQGEVDVQASGYPASRARWDLSVLPLLSGSAAASVTVSGRGHELRGAVTATQTRVTVTDATGQATSEYVNAVAERYGLEFGGELDLVRGMTIVSGQWPETLSADLAWTGGDVVNHLGGEREAWRLPPLTATAGMDGRDIVLDVFHSDGPVARITLREDGWVAIRLLARLFLVAGLPWPTGQAPDEVALELEQQLWKPV